MTQIESIRDAVLEGADGETIGALPLPEVFRAAVVRAEEQEMFAGLPSEAKDPRKSTHVEDVPLPELAPDEAYIGVMASAINFNTVWTSIFEPLPTFQFLQRLGKESVWGKRHDQPFHVMGSDAAGVVLRVGSAVRNWKPGDQVTVHCNYVDDQDPSSHDDSMLTVNQRIWGFESNYGGLAEIALVRANQLMPKPTQLTWEEADCNAEGYKFWKDDTEQDPGEWRRFGKKVRELAGADPDIVFEHPGRSTMGASVFVCRRGGMIITCAATSGFKIEYDNRYLWMNLKTIKGCHFANYREAWEANRLVGEGKIHPTLSVVYPLDQTGEAAAQVHGNLVEGKVGVLCLAPEEGLGVTNPALRDQHLDQITLFRRHHKGVSA